MNTQELLDRKKAIEDNFNALVNQKSEVDSELNRLQGEYRVVNDLLTKMADEEAFKVERPTKRLRKAIEDAENPDS